MQSSAQLGWDLGTGVAIYYGVEALPQIVSVVKTGIGVFKATVSAVQNDGIIGAAGSAIESLWSAAKSTFSAIKSNISAWFGGATEFSAQVNAADLAVLQSCGPNDGVVGIVDETGKISLFKQGVNGINGHAELVTLGLATPGETLGFWAGQNANGTTVVLNISELNREAGFASGEMPASIFNAVKQTLGAN